MAEETDRRAYANKIAWVVVMLIQEEPRKLSDLERTTGFDRIALCDLVSDLMAQGVVRVRRDWKLEVVS